MGGTIAGKPFASREATAFVWEAPVTCANPEFTGWTMAMIQIAFSDVAGSCDLARDTGFCGAKAGARVRGRTELRFDNGDVLSGGFDAPVCPASAEAQCLAMKGGCSQAVTCVP